MKKTFTLLVVLLCAMLKTQAQGEEGFRYQSVIRTPAGDVVANKPAGIRFSILKNAANGETVYSETHTAVTGATGQIQLVIGSGTPVTGQFAAIDWSAGNYFIQTEYDLGSGFALSGIQQLLAVPYALSASTADGLETATFPQAQTLEPGRWVPPEQGIRTAFPALRPFRAAGETSASLVAWR